MKCSWPVVGGHMAGKCILSLPCSWHVPTCFQRPLPPVWKESINTLTKRREDWLYLTNPLDPLLWDNPDGLEAAQEEWSLERLGWQWPSWWPDDDLVHNRGKDWWSPWRPCGSKCRTWWKEIEEEWYWESWGEVVKEDSIDGRRWRQPRPNHKTIYIQDRSSIKWPISNGPYLDPYLSIKPFALTVLHDFFSLTLYSNFSHDH